MSDFSVHMHVVEVCVQTRSTLPFGGGHRRQHDEGAAAAGDASAARASLHRAVFLVLLRTSVSLPLLPSLMDTRGYDSGLHQLPHPQKLPRE